MYQVGIHADPASFLDWDKPLSQQSPYVQNAIGINQLPQKPTPEETSAVFAKAKSLGVPASSLPEYQELERRMDTANTDAWAQLGIDPPNVPMRPEEITGQMFHQGLGQKRIAPQELGGSAYPEVSDDLKGAWYFRHQVS